MPILRISICLTLFCVTCSTTFADDWPQFLGTARNGVSRETNLIESFPTGGPAVSWRTELGVGMSGVAVVGGTVYTLYQDNEYQYLVALDETTGQQKWKTVVSDAYRNSMGNGPRATPTVAGAMAFVYTADGILAALSVDNGDVKWKVDTLRDLATRPADYGMASSPLVIDDQVVVHVGSHMGTVAAWDVKLGERRWAVGDHPSGYSSPVRRKIHGIDQIVAFAAASVMGISPIDGSELWSYPFETEYDCNIALPVLLNESSLLISAGENHGSTILKLTRKGDDWIAEPTWSSLGKHSVLRAEWQTPVQTDGHMFGLDNIGSAGPVTNLVCVNIDSGEQTWIQKRFGKSNLTLADGKLFISTMSGELVIVRATPDGFQELDRATVLGMTRQAPVIANGHLYLRDDKEVVCIDIRSRG